MPIVPQPLSMPGRWNPETRIRRRASIMLMAVLALGGPALLACPDPFSPGPARPLKVFILAGDENILEHGVIEGRTEGIHEDFYPNAQATKGERKKHVRVAVYAGRYSPGRDYEQAQLAAAGMVEIGDQRTKQAQKGKRGRVPVPLTPFPAVAWTDDTTTVLRGYVTVKFPGKYRFLPGSGEAASNVTTVEGQVIYRREIGQAQAAITPVELEPGKRYAFRTIFFGKPGHDFRLPLTNMPGTLTTAVEQNPRYAFLRNEAGGWMKRDDVILYDAHPIHNNTKAIGRFLQVGDVSYGGQKVFNAIGPELMFGHTMGDHLEEPVLLLRFGTRHPIWFLRGSRSLGHDYRPPSSGGTADHDGGWDVIHFNWGVWDAVYRDESSRFYQGRHTTSVEDYGNNLRKLVARLKQTGATLIWANTTPVYKGEPGRPNGEVAKFNAVAEQIMRENGVIINDLHAESLRQGFPKSVNVHSVGNLAPKVTETILAALEARPRKTKPLPRVLLIGDSITGSYEKQVMKDFDGKAFVCKNPGNAESTWTGVEKIDAWLDLKQYLLNGQEYLELVNGIKGALDNLERVVPGYEGQGAELAGLVWFQGVKDSQSEYMTAGYEKNLASLIKDLRQDLKAPALPVVVATIGPGGETMTPNTRKVIAAQMAMADPARHPEFQGNVSTIDTGVFYRPVAESPGGRAASFNDSAESFLEIGEAMGRAMIELMEN